MGYSRIFRDQLVKQPENCLNHEPHGARMLEAFHRPCQVGELDAEQQRLKAEAQRWKWHPVGPTWASWVGSDGNMDMQSVY